MSDERKTPKFGDLVRNPMMGIEGLYLGETGRTWQYDTGAPRYREWYVLITKGGTYSAPWTVGSIQDVFWESEND